MWVNLKAALSEEWENLGCSAFEEVVASMLQTEELTQY
jgi:hypothetical protein